MDIKCRSCRKALVTPEHQAEVINSHGTPWNNAAGLENNNSSCISITNPTSLYIDPDSVSGIDWIQKEIQDSEWSKAKLKCPSCQAVVGSFSFLNSIPCSCSQFYCPPLQLIVSKVDVKKDLSLPHHP